MFGLFKKKSFPIMLNEHMYPVDENVSLSDAKKVFEIFLTKIKFAKPSEIKALLKEFTRELKEHGEFLREGIADDKDELQELKAGLTACKKEAKGAEEKVKVELQKKIEELSDEIESLKEDIESQVSESKAFRESKREFTL